MKRMLMLRRGLARLIVIVLLVAISIAFIYVLINWIRSQTSALEETWQIIPMVYVSYGTASTNKTTGEPVLVLIIVNQGFGTGKIVRVELWIGDSAYIYKPSTPILIKPKTVEKIVIPPPGESWEILGSPPPIVPGTHCRVKIYLASGAIVIYDVVAEESS